MQIIFKSFTFEVELNKRTIIEGLNTISVYLCRDLSSPSRSVGVYIVAVKQGRETLHFLRFRTMQTAFQTYLDYICRYA